ncbi:MAG: undecaprenyl-diphosphatase UppP [Candidatus Omnitrophica bacterium]|nr:undecaprenyl-diphosphatase UppP [Candidatus Omnitrophota bacterium]MDD5518672.1 undecaprenyl-diphosphatase UppP [Candidatus Omnitrophota bacterium]
MDLTQAIFLGIIEGITEFLPISSTGHLMLASRSMGISQTEFVKSFEIAIQSGAILAVVILYWKELSKNLDIWKKIFTAFFPTMVIGALLYKVIKTFFLSSDSVVLWALFLGGIALILFEILHGEKQGSSDELTSISYPQALIIGLFQSIAVIPGVSRAAATIVGGLAVGLKRKTIVEFSFLLAIPTLCAATALDLAKSAGSFKTGQFLVLGAGFIVSLLVALLAIKFLLVFIKKHTFIPFGIYRILIAAVFWLKFR